MIKLLIGGSPCTHWSIAQTKHRETKAEGLGWELFRNYLIAKEKFKPDLFLYENNKSAAQPIKEQISKELGVDLMHINSALVSAQNRQRFYAFNWHVQQPIDREILLKNTLEGNNIAIPVNTTVDGKAQCLRATYYKDGMRNMICNNVDRRTCVAIPSEYAEGLPVYKVCNGLIFIKENAYPIELDDGYYAIRKLTVTECCRLQTLPDDYCRAVSPTQAYKGIGNGWTAEVIIHILNGALRNVPRDEEIIVLSMYDGIGTGRYCLNKMGFTNIRYYAYEIDKYAMKVANSNFPDIIQCGDAFDLRRNGWEIGG